MSPITTSAIDPDRLVKSAGYLGADETRRIDAALHCSLSCRASRSRPHFITMTEIGPHSQGRSRSSPCGLYGKELPVRSTSATPQQRGHHAGPTRRSPCDRLCRRWITSALLICVAAQHLPPGKSRPTVATNQPNTPACAAATARFGISKLGDRRFHYNPSPLG
jgi:hypothetical protein